MRSRNILVLFFEKQGTQNVDMVSKTTKFWWMITTGPPLFLKNNNKRTGKAKTVKVKGGKS